MTPVSDKHNEHRPPTGNLEDLFRQQLGEAELTPRADMWDRLDHELLLRENQGYRRRLVGYRRAAAAAAAVATLGLGGWLTQHLLSTTAPTGQDVAAVVDGQSAAERAAARLGQAADQQAAGRFQRNSTVAASPAAAAAVRGEAADVASANNGLATASQAAEAADGSSVLGNLRESFGARRRATGAAETSSISQALAAIKQSFGGGSGSAAASGSRLATTERAIYAANTEAGAAAGTTTGLPRSSANGYGSGYAAGVGPSMLNVAWSADNADALSPVASRLLRAGLGAGLPDSLKASLLNSSTLLAAQTDAAEDDEKNPTTSSRWRWRGGYTAQRFMPNASSVSNKVIYSAIPSAGAAVPRAAMQQEATQLEAGLAQRGQLGVAVPLSKKHWTLLTGAEVAVITGRTGRQVTQSYNAQSNLLDQKFQAGRYQLTTVGVPVQVRYESRRQGWGVYAAVGAAVNVLLRNRTEVGTQITANDASFRSVLASARGNAGVRFSPANGNWQLNVGPEAEAGLNTLNANPTESWAQRTRPYALGLSASVEFGGGKTDVAPR